MARTLPFQKMMRLFVIAFLAVSGTFVFAHDATVLVNEDLVKLVKEMQTTIMGMNRQMTIMAGKVESLEEDNIILKQRLLDVENFESEHSAVHQNATHTHARRLLMDESEVVAFLASEVTPVKEDHLGVNQNILFDTVLTNLGGGFNVNHGIFTAPRSGVYIISAAVLSWVDSEIRASIMVNGQRTVSMFGHGSVGRPEQGTQVAVLQLNVGDTVAIEYIELADNTIYGNRYTSFTGVLLYPMA